MPSVSRFVFGIHPITGLYGGIFLAVIIFVTLIGKLKTKQFFFELLSTLLSGFIVLAILLPWIYVTLKFSNQLLISQGFFQQLVYYDGIDEILVRLSPFPLDLRSVNSGVNVGSPYLDSQINLPAPALLVLYTWFFGLPAEK